MKNAPNDVSLQPFSKILTRLELSNKNAAQENGTYFESGSSQESET